MSDLISRQAAIEAIKRCESSWSYGINTGVIMAMNAVADVPTIDPVKRGKWRWFPDKMVSDTDVSFVGECSVCKHLSKECGRFCNWCGARMDGE